MDLLGSILGSMQKPPSVGDAERKKAKEQKELFEKQQEKEKQKLNSFREKMQKQIHEFIKDSSRQKYQFKPMDKVLRAIVHEVADVAGLTSFSFGHEEEDRYVMLWKKEFAPTDDELLAYRRGEVWDPEKAKELAKQKELDAQSEASHLKRKHEEVAPSSNYREKYKHLIGEEAAKDAAKSTIANKSYGFVPSHNKRDQRTIEQVLADSRAKKKLKTEGESAVDPPEGAVADPDTSQ
ncbi:sperm-associated antigen 7-like [Haliotis rufescens]|uniref:sperm-associated antigen 7-like n=1 Tax=Haliotis rufescens TaxID=6454 RepID=UPI001EB09336|nr:sperm-associated antigen 7-like [Haliotis rufescens]